MVCYARSYRASLRKETAVVEKTCAACDCKLEGEVVTVTLDGNEVDVCCDDCATQLQEAAASAKGG